MPVIIVAQGQGLVRDSALVQATIGCCILLLLVPKMVLTLSYLHWWRRLSCHQLVQRPHLHLQWTSPATCPGGVFLYQLMHLLMCTHDLPCCHYPLQLALAMVFPLPTRHLQMCTHAHEHTFCNLHCGVVVCGSDFRSFLCVWGGGEGDLHCVV